MMKMGDMKKDSSMMQPSNPIDNNMDSSKMNK
jgi:hypothetical protein